MTTATDVPAPPSLWRNRSFNLLWGSQTLSDLGTSMSMLAFPLLVLAITDSPLQAGVLGTVTAIVRAAVRLPAGVYADRWPRKRIMLACDAVRIAGYAALGVLIAMGDATMPLLYAVALVDAVASVLFSTTEAAAIRNVVPGPQVAGAVARNEARQHAASLVGPPLGGLLFQFARALPFVADAVSYVLSFVGVALVRTPLQETRTEPAARTSTAMGEGIRFVRREPVLRAVLFIAAPINLAYNGLIFGIILLLQRAGTPPALIGTVDTILGVGGLIGAVIAAAVIQRFHVRSLILAVTWAGVGLIALSALFTHNVLVVVPTALSLVLSPALNSSLFAYQAAITPDRLQGRVVSIIYFVAMSLATFAPFLAGVMVETLPGPVVVLVFAAILGIGALAATFSEGVRTMRPLAEVTAAANEPAAEAIGPRAGEEAGAAAGEEARAAAVRG